MSIARRFLDSNLIIYANDINAGDKYERSLEIVLDAIRAQWGVISTQVLQEYAATAIYKLKQPLPVVREQLASLRRLEVVTVTPDMIDRAIDMHERYQIKTWDGIILAAAEQARCSIVWSEDMNNGQRYGDVTVENPLINLRSSEGS